MQSLYPIRFLVALFCLVGLVHFASARITTRYVSTTGTELVPASATSWATSTSMLQETINVSGTGDQVWIAAGIYTPTSNTAEPPIYFHMRNDVTIYGGFAGNETSLSQRPTLNPPAGQHSGTILSGDLDRDGPYNRNSYHVFRQSGLNSTAVMDGVVITAAYSIDGTGENKRGAGMVNLGSSPTLTNCTFQSNTTLSDGGAMYNKGSTPKLTNCVFDNNYAADAFISDPTNLTTSISPFVSATSAQLRLGSLAINAGDPNTTTATLGIDTDLASNSRITFGSIDMGAYEYQEGACNTTVYVTPTGAGNLDGSSWANAIDGNSLASALATACGSTTFLVAGGLYKPTTGTSRTDGFYIPSGIQVYGGYEAGTSNRTTYPSIGAPTGTTLSGDIDNDGILNNGNSYHVVRFTNASTQTRLDGVVITGGEADGINDDSYGAGIRNIGGNPVLTNLVITGNRAAISGGGMYNLNSGQGDVNYPLLSNVTFSNNTATSNTGGGLYNHGNSFNTPCSPVLENLVFESNDAINAGGLSVHAQASACNPILKRVRFSNNRARNGGGGALLSGAIGNYANTQLINCSFTNNQATGQGGAILNGALYSNTATLLLTNCSFTNNTATAGGDLYNLGVNANSKVQASLTNCVLFGNGANAIVNSSASLSATYSLFEPSSVTGMGIDVGGPGNLTTTVSPFAGTTSTELTACSPAIDAGFNSAPGLTGITTDLAGNDRFYNSRVDMGAYEAQNNLAVAIVDETLVEGPVCPGGSANPSVSVTGAVISYQWYNNGTAVAGKTTAELSLTNVQPDDAGSYVVVVTGACNSVTSTVFTITVNTPLPPITSIGTQAALPGQATQLSATAQGRVFVWTGPGGYVYSTVFRTGGVYNVLAPGSGSGQYVLTVYDGPCQTSATVQQP